MRLVHFDCFAVSIYFVIYTDVLGWVNIVPYYSVKALWVDGSVVVLVKLLGGRGGRE